MGDDSNADGQYMSQARSQAKALAFLEDETTYDAMPHRAHRTAHCTAHCCLQVP